MKKQFEGKSIGKRYENIREIIDKARDNFFRTANFILITTYWNIGREIVEEKQEGKARGKYVIKKLSGRLTAEYGKGFTIRNLRWMRHFYRYFPIRSALRTELSWTYYKILLNVENESARNFYMHEAINSHWNTRELERQIKSGLFERLERELIRLLNK